MIYKLQNGWTIPLGGDYLEYLQSIPETYGGSIQSSIKIEPLPKKFNGSQKAARTYAEGYLKGSKPVTKAIDNAGQKIFNTTKNVAMFVPGPIGATTWLGQMGADTANGEYSKVAKDLVAAVLIGAGLKGAQAGAKAAGRALAGKGVNIPWLDAYDYSALRNEYFTNAGNKAMVKATPDIVQMSIEAGKLGWAPSSKQTLWHNSEQPLTRLKIDFPAWDVTERGAPLGHTWLTGTETTEGFLGTRPYHLKGNIQLSKPMIQIGEAIGNGKNNTRNQILDFAQKSSADAINFKSIADNTLQNQNVYSVFKNVDLNDNLKLDDVLRTRGSAQEAATTYHFDGRMPLSRPISEAELKGWTKQFRNQRHGQISASEYSGLPKGERNNGRYGDIRFIRHMDAVPELTEDGFVQIAPEQNWLANFTTDKLMTPHKGYPKQAIGKNVLIISPEAFRGTTPFSLDPGDSFFINSELKIKPKHITFISGDKQALQLAKERGFNTESSPKLKILSKFINPATWEEQGLMRPELEKKGYWFYGRQYPKIKSDYVDELNRVLHTRFNRPSLKDYSNIESVTGVPTHTYSRSTAPWQSFFGPKTGYQQVIYDTTPQIEHDLMEQIDSYAHPMAASMKNYSPLFFRLRKGWVPIKKQGGIIKGQNGFLNTWQKAYSSKFGKGLRDFMFGKDRDLSDEEYFNKYGYNKPIGGLGPLVEMTTIGPVGDFSGVSNVVKGTFGNGGVRANVGLQSMNAEKRAIQLAKSYDEELRRDKAAIEWAGRKWKELNNTEQYWLKVNHGNLWDDKLIIPRP